MEHDCNFMRAHRLALKISKTFFVILRMRGRNAS